MSEFLQDRFGQADGPADARSGREESVVLVVTDPQSSGRGEQLKSDPSRGRDPDQMKIIIDKDS